MCGLFVNSVVHQIGDNLGCLEIIFNLVVYKRMESVWHSRAH